MAVVKLTGAESYHYLGLVFTKGVPAKVDAGVADYLAEFPEYFQILPDTVTAAEPKKGGVKVKTRKPAEPAVAADPGEVEI